MILGIMEITVLRLVMLFPWILLILSLVKRLPVSYFPLGSKSCRLALYKEHHYLSCYFGLFLSPV